MADAWKSSVVAQIPSFLTTQAASLESVGGISFVHDNRNEAVVLSAEMTKEDVFPRLQSSVGIFRSVTQLQTLDEQVAIDYLAFFVVTYEIYMHIFVE